MFDLTHASGVSFCLLSYCFFPGFNLLRSFYKSGTTSHKMRSTGLNSKKSWVIAVLCSFVNLMCTLPLRISALIFVALMEGYNISRKTASQPITVAIMIRCVLGPLTGYLCELFGCRPIVTSGAILTSFGLGACFYAEDITFVIISIGLLYGPGLCFGNTLIPMVVKEHFDKHVSKAIGVSLIGTCVNAIIIPPFFQYLLVKYGAAGAFLITSGVMLNGLPAALLLKNPNYNRTSQTKRKSEGTFPLNEIPQICNNNTSVVNRKEEVVTHGETDDFNLSNPGVSKSRSEGPFLMTLNEIGDQTSVLLDLNLPSATINIQNKVNVPVFKSDTRLNYKHEEGEEEYPLRLPQLKYPCNTDVKCKAFYESLKVFKDPSYFIILISQACIPFIIITIWQIIIDISRDKAIPGNLEIYFLMLLPVSELIGYVGLSWITDNGYLSTTKFFASCYVSLAFSIVGLVWSYEFFTMMIAVLVVNFFGAAVTTTSSVVIFEFIEEKRQAMAMSSRFVLYVPLGLATPSFIGYSREGLGSYNWLLYLLAIASLFCGLLFLLMPYTVLYKQRRKNSRL